MLDYNCQTVTMKKKTRIFPYKYDKKIFPFLFNKWFLIGIYVKTEAQDYLNSSSFRESFGVNFNSVIANRGT